MYYCEELIFSSQVSNIFWTKYETEKIASMTTFRRIFSTDIYFWIYVSCYHISRIGWPNSSSMICFLHNLILSLSSALQDINCSFSSKKSWKCSSSAEPRCFRSDLSIWNRNSYELAIWSILYSGGCVKVCNNWPTYYETFYERLVK